MRSMRFLWSVYRGKKEYLKHLSICLGVGGGLISLFKGEFLDWYGGISRLSDHTYEVQNLLQGVEAVLSADKRKFIQE